MRKGVAMMRARQGGDRAGGEADGPFACKGCRCDGADDAATAKKRQRELDTVQRMIGIYCQGHHATERDELCAHCRELSDYVVQRIERCPLTESKTFCSSCPVHCYRPEMRERIREVMRYAGPRMLLVNPGKAFAHALDTMRTRHRSEKKSV